MRLPAMLTVLVVLAGCTNAGSEPEATSPSNATPPEALSLVPFEHGNGSLETTLSGCASVGDDQDEGYTLPILIWARLRVASKVRLLPATWAKRSNSLDGIAQFVGPDPGPEAPHMAISIGSAGAGPTATRDTLRYDTHLIGDSRNSPAGIAGAKSSWAGRVALGADGVTLTRGDHYLFLEVDPAKGGMDLHELTANWRTAGGKGQLELGELSVRQQCGG
jgi:hypothetical protein